jgi:hypothetical protein
MTPGAAIPAPKFTSADDVLRDMKLSKPGKASAAAAAAAEPELLAKIEDAPARVARLQKRLGYSVSAITLVLLTELGVDGVAHQVLYPLVRDRVHHMLREKARNDYDRSQLQHTADKRSRAAGGQGVPRPQAVTASASRLAFLEFKVIMAGAPQGFKLYKDLTAQEHESRRAMLQRSAEPVLRSARSHAWAKAMIERHKAARLADIGRDVIEKELPAEGVRP